MVEGLSQTLDLKMKAWNFWRFQHFESKDLGSWFPSLEFSRIVSCYLHVLLHYAVVSIYNSASARGRAPTSLEPRAREKERGLGDVVRVVRGFRRVL